MTNTIENKIMEQARNAGEVMGKLLFAQGKLKAELASYTKHTKKPDAILQQSIAETIKTLEECYNTLKS
jgi:hypothetical protein